jgi:predicted nucleic acid-binding protein
MSAAKLKSRYAISYADAFAAATAIIRESPLLTGDPELRAVATQEKILQLEWIGR